MIDSFNSPINRSRTWTFVQLVQVGSVKRNMVFHEACYEVITVIIPGLHPKSKRLVRFRTGHRQQFRLQLFDKKVVRITLVDQDLTASVAGFDQFHGIIH